MKCGRIRHKKTTVENITFDSGMESDYYLELRRMQDAGDVLKIDRQVKFELQESFIIVNNNVIFKSNKDFSKLKKEFKCETVQAINYITDFVVTYKDGSVRAIDPKGRSTTEFKIKRKMFMLKYPHIPLDVIVYNKKTHIWEDLFEYEANARKAKREKKKNKK